MRILIDVNHPAHVHLFRCAADEWIKRGHRVFWTARDKDIVVDLLRCYGIRFHLISAHRSGHARMAFDMLMRNWLLFRYACKVKPHVMLGTSVNITHVSRVYPAKSIFFTESDPQAIKLISLLSFPFAHALVMPDIFQDTWKYKQYKHSSSHKLAYLHPNRFKPDPTVCDELGVRSGDTFFILRFIAWSASHDVGQRGLEVANQKKIIACLLKHGKVFISSETELIPELEPYRINIRHNRMHDAIYFAKLFIGDSQSMTMEAAILGTPALRCNSFVGRLSILEEMNHKYGLCYGFLPDESDKFIAKIKELLNRNNLKEQFLLKRDKYLEDKCDFTEWMVNFVENFIKPD